MENPNDLKYSKDHEWLKTEGETGTVGVTDHAQELLTDVVFVELPKVGDKVEAHKPMCVIESVKSVSDVFSPVDGEISEVNSELEAHPEFINEDPYGKGWIVKIKMSGETPEMMSKQEYEGMIKQ